MLKTTRHFACCSSLSERDCLLRFLFLVALMTTVSPAKAQSFFTTLVIDPAVGVDRGSASRIQEVVKNTGFLTFSSDGAEEIGPYVLGLGAALPAVLGEPDQLDLVAVLSGPADDDRHELLAAGAAYRFNFPSTDMTLTLNSDFADARLGSATSLALGLEGHLSNVSLGIRREWAVQGASRSIASLELTGRDSQTQALGAVQEKESLRMLRTSFTYFSGRPFAFQKRHALSATKGFDDFGALPNTNQNGSAPEGSSDFFRVAAGAEMSLPISPRIYLSAGVAAQWSDDSLPISQRCGYQSNDYAKGFDRSYVNGDKCLAAQLELAYNVTLPQPGANKLSYSQSYIGFDGGYIKDNPSATLAANADNWSSVSLGIRALHGNLLGEISLSHILDQPVGAFAQDETRLWFRSAMKF